jgi:hypothetical protein
MKVEIILTTIGDGQSVETVVAIASVAHATNIERFLTWHAEKLFTTRFTLRRGRNLFSWAAVDANGNTLTVR